MDHQKHNPNSDIEAHQEGVIAHFPFAKRELTYSNELPDFVHTYPLGPVEHHRADHERKETVVEEIASFIPEVFEQYARDLLILQKKKGSEANLLGVTFDQDTQKITAPGVYHKDRFTSSPKGILGMGSTGRYLSSPAFVESDIVISIEKKLINIDASGEQENLYIAEVVRTNSETHEDEWESWRDEDGKVLMQIAVDPTYHQVFAHLNGSPVRRSKTFTETFELMKKAFPRT